MAMSSHEQVVPAQFGKQLAAPGLIAKPGRDECAQEQPALCSRAEVEALRDEALKLGSTQQLSGCLRFPVWGGFGPQASLPR